MKPLSGEENEIQNILKEIISRELGISIESIDSNTTLTTMGVDSLAIAEIVTQSEAIWGVSISPQELLQHPTLEQISNLIATRKRE